MTEPGLAAIAGAMAKLGELHTAFAAGEAVARAADFPEPKPVAASRAIA